MGAAGVMLLVGTAGVLYFFSVFYLLFWNQAGRGVCPEKEGMNSFGSFMEPNKLVQLLTNQRKTWDRNVRGGESQWIAIEVGLNRMNARRGAKGMMILGAFNCQALESHHR